jgi:hypothetical protein
MLLVKTQTDPMFVNVIMVGLVMVQYVKTLMSVKVGLAAQMVFATI